MIILQHALMPFFLWFQIKSNQITFIVTSPQHKCLGEWNSYERAPDSAKKQQTIYIWTDSAKKQQQQFTYGQTVQKNNKQFTYGQTVQKNNSNLHMDSTFSTGSAEAACHLTKAAFMTTTTVKATWLELAGWGNVASLSIFLKLSLKGPEWAVYNRTTQVDKRWGFWSIPVI